MTTVAFGLAAVTGMLSPEFTDFDQSNPIGVDAFEETWLGGAAALAWIGTMAGWRPPRFRSSSAFDGQAAWNAHG